MNRRFDLKGWGPILAAALFGFVLGTSGVTVLWPKMWEGAKLSDSLGFWGGIFGFPCVFSGRVGRLMVRAKGGDDGDNEGDLQGHLAKREDLRWQ